MRVVLDAQLALGTATGIGEYASGLAGALRELGCEVVTASDARFDPWRFDRRVLWDQVLLPLRALRAHGDLLHCTSGTIPLVAPLPVVVTVHDVAWLRVQQHARPYARWYFGRFSVERYRGAREIVVDSEFSRRELLALLDVPPGRVSVVSPGVAPEFGEVLRQQEEAPVILAVGTVERRKNLGVVIRALAELPGVRLISLGPSTPYQAECEALAHDLGVAQRVTFAGYRPREELLAHYASAAVAVVPSRYEGFGYGVAQALCAGIPLVAADASSLPEVAGPGVPLVAPDDAAGWARALGAELADRTGAEARAAARRSAALARFSWASAARATFEVYARALNCALPWRSG
jgi:glycosyltransferase involved in cell wall biosynthesis